MKKTIYVHTGTTDQYSFDDVADALIYIEELLENMSSETITVSVQECDA